MARKFQYPEPTYQHYHKCNRQEIKPSVDKLLDRLAEEVQHARD
jgi:hypothetical protein